MMMGGSFFPFEAMPELDGGRRDPRLPNGWALLHLKRILAGSDTGAELGLAFGGLLPADDHPPASGGIADVVVVRKELTDVPGCAVHRKPRPEDGAPRS